MTKLTPKQKELVSIAVEGVLLALILAVVVSTWNKKHVTVNTHTVVVSASPKVVVDTKTTTNTLTWPGGPETVAVPVSSIAAGYKLSMQVPAAWRAVDIRNLVSASDYKNLDLGAILRFVPEHPERSTANPTVEPVNTLDVVGTAKWEAVSDGAPATPANKQAYLSYLGSLKTLNDITANKCTPITSGGSVCADAKVKPQIVQSADGSLSGLAYLVLGTQSVEYDPSVVVEMAGNVSGKPVHVSGVFRIYDQQYETLGGNGVNAQPNASNYASKVQAARTAFAGGPPADTMDMYSRIVAAVQSMKFSK